METKKRMKATDQDIRISRIVTWVITLVAIALLVVSFIMPPPGQIEPSVMDAFQGLMGLIGLIGGLDLARTGKVLHLRYRDFEFFIGIDREHNRNRHEADTDEDLPR